MTLIEELYYGKLRPAYLPIDAESKLGSLSRSVTKQEDNLIRILDESQGEQLAKLLRAVNDLSEEEACHSFTLGYQIGVRLLLEALAVPQENLLVEE